MPETVTSPTTASELSWGMLGGLLAGLLLATFVIVCYRLLPDLASTLASLFQHLAGH